MVRQIEFITVSLEKACPTAVLAIKSPNSPLTLVGMFDNQHQFLTWEAIAADINAWDKILKEDSDA